MVGGVSSADRRHPARGVLGVTVIGSALLCLGMGVVHYQSGSELALAHAADSGLDMVTALVLAWAVAAAIRPRDESHPFGHTRAEPIGALFMSFIAGALAFEVARDAVLALLGGHVVRPSFALAIFGLKAAFKIAILLYARGKPSPAMQALRMDARNDVATSVLAAFGVWGATMGRPNLDAWLALPLALWIAWNGFGLARENIRRLMGEAPPAPRLEEIRDRARTANGVRDVHDVRAHYLGTHIQVHLHIVVDEDLTVKQAHDIGEEVRHRIEADDDVAQCLVHIDVAG